MAADLHIHVFEGITEEDLALFFSHTIGSKYFNGGVALGVKHDAYQKIEKTPGVWVGEVSWLKAAVFGDEKTFIPMTVQLVSLAIGEDLPVLDEALMDKILAAFEAPNATGYSLARKDDVRAFLDTHRGKRVFTVSW